MARRILVALVAVAAVLTIGPTPLGSEPVTTGPSPTTAASTPAPLPTTFTPNPHAVYPRRPGAKYDDFEVPPNGSVTFLATVSIARATIEPRRALPPVWQPATRKDYTQSGLVDGYAPHSIDTTGAVLHVVAHEANVHAPIPLACIATAAGDGSVLVPYTRHPPAPKPKPTHTGTSKSIWAPFDVNLYFPLGSHRGRIYLTCTQVFVPGLTLGLATHVVWGIDV